ncbi:MAG: hypothetical protein AAF657_21680, partial [Acidobacteriota bacterium]
MVVAVLLALCVNWWIQQPPERFAVARIVVMDPSDVSHERGHAYWLRLPWGKELASDKESLSRIVLLEEGEELTGHALHADIRQHGAGLYSHWGNAILFSSRDGTDPRTNGYRYEMRVPAVVPAWHRGARLALMV